jgi:hypothetical protein
MVTSTPSQQTLGFKVWLQERGQQMRYGQPSVSENRSGKLPMGHKSHFGYAPKDARRMPSRLRHDQGSQRMHASQMAVRLLMIFVLDCHPRGAFKILFRVLLCPKNNQEGSSGVEIGQKLSDITHNVHHNCRGQVGSVEWEGIEKALRPVLVEWVLCSD